MRRLLILAVTGLIAAGCQRPAPEAAEEAVAADEPKPPAAVEKDAPPALAKVFAERNRLHKRQTGALLTITAKWDRQPGLEPGVVIDWRIDYDGPRRPFTILTPTLSFPAAGQTTAHFWYVDAQGQTAGFNIAAGMIEGKPPRKGKEWFTVAADGKPVSGRIVAAGVSYLKAFIGREPGPGDPPLWAQLEHAPTDRGDGFEMLVEPGPLRRVTQGPPWTLDAWTGKLWSPVAPVDVE